MKKVDAIIKVSANNSTNFIVTLYGYEDQNLKGKIEWLDTGQQICFRSTSELNSLLEEAYVNHNNTIVETKRSWRTSRVALKLANSKIR